MSIIKIWKNKDKIFEGIKNSIFKKEHVEEIYEERRAVCQACIHRDDEGKTCMVPGTQPCCGLCGCSLGFKLRSLSSQCDDKRWKAVLSEEEADKLNEHLGDE